MKRYHHKDHSHHVLRHKTDSLLLLAVYVKANQAKVAKYLQLKTERLSKKGKKISLFMFSVLFGGCSIVIMLYAFLSANKPVSTQRITFPKYVIVQRLKPKIRDSLITYHEYARINQFKHYLEHLQEDATSRKVYDSILQVRPFLLDSLHTIDSIFLTQ